MYINIKINKNESSGFHSNRPLDYKLSRSEVKAKISLTKRTSTFMDKPIRILR